MQTKVDKTPFRLRRRRLADGRESLFIDCIAAGKHEYAFLSLYLVPGTSVKAKRENARTASSSGRDCPRQDRSMSQRESTGRSGIEEASEESTD